MLQACPSGLHGLYTHTLPALGTETPSQEDRPWLVGASLAQRSLGASAQPRESRWTAQPFTLGRARVVPFSDQGCLRAGLRPGLWDHSSTASRKPALPVPCHLYRNP